MTFKPKSKIVKLKISSQQLSKFGSIDQHATPKSKAKPKKPAASPTPETPAPLVNPKPPSGLSRVINAEDFKLDKSGKPTRRWVKKPVEIQSFTGYFMDFTSWAGLPKDGDAKTEGQEEPGEQKPIKIQIKLNNKNLNIGDTPAADSREGSPDIASSVVSTPDVSAVSTPAP